MNRKILEYVYSYQSCSRRTFTKHHIQGSIFGSIDPSPKYLLVSKTPRISSPAFSTSMLEYQKTFSRSPSSLPPTSPTSPSLAVKQTGSQGGSSGGNRMLSWRELIAWGITGCGIIALYFGIQKQKEQKNRKKEKEKEIKHKRKIGNATVGGPLAGLIDHNGNVITEKTFLGKWIILYFGFCHCPDICPDKMEMLSDAVTAINQMDDVPNLLPLFITVDPRRDTPEHIQKYLSDFHPDFIGLTGEDEEQLKKILKAYHVYQSYGEPDEDNDYIVDHTVVLYLMDEDGKFSDYYGRSATLDEVVNGVRMKMDMALGRI